MPTPLILVADDSPLVRAMLGRALREAGYAVIETEDGVEAAVEAFRTQPAVVVTDLDMPVMDGCQLARLLKNDPLTSHLPVVILTSHREASSRFWGETAGADAYLVKDDVDAELLPTVHKLAIARRNPVASDERPPSGPLEILGRVARQLDTGLLEATLINRVLRKGVEVDNLDAAVSSLLEVFSRIADAELLGIGLADESTACLYLQRPEAARAVVDLDAVSAFVGEILGLEEDLPLMVRIDGNLATTGPPLSLESARRYPLHLRQARGSLLVWPQEAVETLQGPADALLATAAPHAALVLDSARLADHLRQLSTHDGLTRLLNHRAILERLDEEVTRSRRYKSALSVALCDIDRFKRLNDSFGHLLGDEALRQFSAGLRAAVRSSDVVGRYGGEEFLLILPNTELDAATATLKRVCVDIAERPLELGPVAGPVTVTASFGVACLAEMANERRATDLLSLADRRLYQAKREGRARVVGSPPGAERPPGQGGEAPLHEVRPPDSKPSKSISSEEKSVGR